MEKVPVCVVPKREVAVCVVCGENYPVVLEAEDIEGHVDVCNIHCLHEWHQRGKAARDVAAALKELRETNVTDEAEDVDGEVEKAARALLVALTIHGDEKSRNSMYMLIVRAMKRLLGDKRVDTLPGICSGR